MEMEKKENEKTYAAAEDAGLEAGAAAAEAGTDPAGGENPYLLSFKKPVYFEGERYDSVDLSGLEDLSAADMIAVNKQIERGGSTNVMPEFSVEYACLIASRACGMPAEFFKALPPREAAKLKNRVINFLYGGD